MVTKDQLDLLKQTHPKLNKELHYTIGGTVETLVHSTLDAERIGELNKGDRLMNEADQTFRHNMAFKSREGLAKSQFSKTAQSVPVQDQRIAESTWRNNAIQGHKDRLDAANNNFRTAMQRAVQGHSQPIDTDLGYGAGQPHPDSKRYGHYKTSLRSASVTAFAQSMQKNEQVKTLGKDH